MVKFFSIVEPPLKSIMTRPTYIFLTIFLAFILIAVTSLIINYKLIADILFSNQSLSFKLSFMFAMLGSIVTNNTEISLLTLIITGILAGINISLLIFKFRSNKIAVKPKKTKGSKLGSLGVAAGVLASGCSSCGIGVLALLGVAGGVAILPLGGLEIWTLSELSKHIVNI